MSTATKILKSKTFVVSIVVCYSFIAIVYLNNAFFSQLYFYVRNGNIVDLKYYYIELPFPEWSLAYDNLGYRIISINREYFDIPQSTGKPEDLDAEETLKIIDPAVVLQKSYVGISGTQYISAPDCFDGHYLLFLSNDKLFYLIKYPYSLTEENEKYLDLLLNSVRKKDNV
jgi:hypothetical protein